MPLLPGQIEADITGEKGAIDEAMAGIATCREELEVLQRHVAASEVCAAISLSAPGLHSADHYISLPSVTGQARGGGRAPGRRGGDPDPF